MSELKEIKPEYPETKIKDKILGSDIHGAPYKALTAASATTLSSGGLTGLTTADSGVLNNALTRIAEIETILKKIGVIK